MLVPLHAPPPLKSFLLEVREVGQDELAEHDPIPPIELGPPEPGQPWHGIVSPQSFQVIPQPQIVLLVGQQLLDRTFNPLGLFRHARAWLRIASRPAPLHVPSAVPSRSRPWRPCGGPRQPSSSRSPPQQGRARQEPRALSVTPLFFRAAKRS